MSCPACGHANRPGRKFCAECGAALALACAACSAPYEAGEKFCGECGTPLGAPIDAGARKVVTIVFADLVGSTALHERLDAESAQRVMERYYEALRAAVDAHGGTVVKLLGDGVMAAFGLKRVAEDDALRAVRAAAAMQEAFRTLVGVEAAALGGAGLRVAVNTGEVVVSGARDDVIGDPVNVAARLQEQGGDGDVVLGEATRRLVATRVTLAPLGSVTLKGRAEAVGAYRLVSLEPPAGAATAPFVGRETELARLEAVYDAAVATPATRLAVLLGSPGLGKSRLIDELGRRHADGATILAAHCDAAGGATFAPLAQVLRGFLGLDDGAGGDAVRAAVAAALPAGDEGERTRIAGGIAGLLGDAATSPEETFFVVRRFLAGLAAARPLVLVIDDLHWAEPLLLDLVEHLVQWGGGVPLFLLVGARPELRDLRSSLVTPSGLVADVITLGGLDAGAAMRLAANVIGAADLPAAVAAKVLATSEGNPLFVGELVRMLVQEGVLTKEGERWTAGAGLAALEMPPTIHALLAARIERLGSEERTVLERASVVGRHFSRSAVAALLGRNGAELDARLESLRRSELIERDTGWLLGEPVLRFHHVLIRDAAYRRLLKGTRAELHARLADWIEGQVGDAPEHDEMIGWHLEQAHQHLRELGPLDAAGAVLGERAARRLAAAGRRALARDDVSLAAGLCGRALDRLTSHAPERADLVLDWCEALLAAGDVGPSAAAIAELDRVAADSARLRAWHTCFAGQLTVLTAPEALHATADRVGAAARELATLNDAAGEAKAHFVHAQALARLGKVGACEAALDLALAAARRAGDRRRANAVLAGAPLAALWGPSPVTRASGRCLDVVRVLRITQGAPAVEAVALSCQGVLEALRGRTEAARRMLASSRTMVEELGISHRLYESDVFAGRIDLLEGDAPAAERALRAGYEGLRDLGLGIDAARAAALLGRALLAQDRAAEAETLSHESELLAGDDLQAAIAWRGVRAEALARRGDPVAAIALAEAAVAIAAATDALLDHADARLALAAALRAGGRRAEADAEKRRAFELWEAKGATVLAERAHRAAGQAQSSPHVVTSVTAPTSAVQRRVNQNAATVLAQAFDAAFAKGDTAAFGILLAVAVLVVDHPTESTYGRDGAIESYERLLHMKAPLLRHEPLATLGASLGLFRRRIAAAGGQGRRVDVGEYDREESVVIDAGVLIEIFAADHLGAAIARLYERYAEKLPEGPSRERATVAARAVAFMLTPGDTPDLMQLYAPTYEDVDHRSVGYGALSLDEAKGKLRESFRDLVDGLRYRVDDVLALDPNGFVRKTTASGVWRGGGGSFERTVCTLSIFGPDGRVTRHETFEPERKAEALARFDALTGGAAPQPAARRQVRPNAATATAARFDAAIAARDEAALAAVCAEALTIVDHPNGAAYGRDGVLASFQRLLRMDDPTMHHEPLATLGESLALFRRRIRASGGRLDVGAYERDEVCVSEVDADGRFRHHETFAAERLRAALVRLYERYAESLPEGPARTRASGVVRALATYDGALDADRIASGHAPSFVCVDHRTLSTWSAQGREEWRRHWQEQAELVADFTIRDDDVLALDPGTSAVRATFAGMSRASGGTIENVVIFVSTHDADGLITRTEVFEPDQEAAALARFDALTADAAPQPPIRRRFRPNTASRTGAAITDAFARRDLGAVDALLGDPLDTIEHPTGTRYGREGQLESSRRMMRMPDLDFRIEPLATLGDAFCLARRVVGASGTAGGKFDVGAYEIESIVVNTVDAAGRLTSSEVFASDHLCQALARFYACYAESLPDGPERTRAAGIASSHSVWGGALDAYPVGSVTAPSFVCIDHRSLGTWSADGRDEWMQHWRGQAELAAGFSRRDEDILAFTPAVNVLRHTYFGTSRASGGLFENVLLAVNVFDADGRYARVEVFEPDQEAAALACFDALTSGAPPKPLVPRRVRPNAATAGMAAANVAFARRDPEAIAALCSPTHEEIDHRTGATWDREGVLASLRLFMRSQDAELRNLPLATLGDALALNRRVLSAAASRGGRFDVGPYENESVSVVEADEHGLVRREEVFAVDRLGDAIARLYARHAELLPEGLARTRAVATARAVATHYQSPTDPDRLAAALAPAIVAVDHRTVGFGELHGRDGVVAAVRALLELSDDVTWRYEAVLALSEHACLARATQRGRSRASGGEWERPICSLRVHGADGLIARWEIFEPDQEAAALARYDELVAESGTAEPVGFSNAATRALERFVQASGRRDWQALSDVFAASLRFDDRRPLLQMQLPKASFLEQHRVLFDVPNGRWITTPIATRGERLVLARLLFQGDVAGGGGALEIDHLSVLEVGDDGRMNGVVLFEPADLDAAYAELDARFTAGEGAMLRVSFSGFVRNVANRDWEMLVAGCAPTLVEHDHRPIVSLGTTYGPEAWVQKNVRTYVDLAPDSLPRFFHVRACERGMMWQMAWEGTREGGRYEILMAGVTELDALGRNTRVDLYEPEQLDQAQARFAELRSTAPPPMGFANAATATVAPVIAAMIAHDWQRFAELLADDFRMSDRRRVVQLELDRDQYITFTREVADGRTIRATSELLATRGERLALTRPVYEFSDADVGPSEIAFLILTEVDARGRIAAYVRWDVDDLDAAYTELDARHEAAEGARHGLFFSYLRALARRDWDAIAALYPPDFVEHDNRVIAVLGTTRGPEAWIQDRALIELAPDTVVRVDHVRHAPRGLLSHSTWQGSRDGAHYEIPFVVVHELDGQGKLKRNDLYDPEQIDRALARFAALAAPAPSPERFANAATRAAARIIAYWGTRDWRGLAQMLPAGLWFQDRRRIALLEGDREQYVEWLRVTGEMTSTDIEVELLATRGDRLALQRRCVQLAGGDVGPSEMVNVTVIATDESGDPVAVVDFDEDALDAAYAELDARWRAGEATVHPGVAVYLTAFVRALASRDWDALAALHAPTLVAHDHRLVGWDVLRGPSAYVGALRAMVDLAPDALGRADHIRTSERGLIGEVVWVGTRDGGAFESPFIWVVELDAEGLAERLDFYDPHHLDAAFARFAELTTSAPRARRVVLAKPNAAGATALRWEAAFGAGSDADWEAMRRLCAAGMIFEDRRRLALVFGDRELMIAAARERVAMGALPESWLVGTAGDRVLVTRSLWSGGPPDGRFEIEYLTMIEVDEAGLLTAMVMFDPDDTRAAQREAWARWAAIEPDVAANLALLARMLDAFNAHDLGSYLATVADDVLIVDHRRTGMGRIEGAAAYAASVEALWSLAPGTTTDLGWHWPAYGRHGAITVNRRHGTLADGGAYESEYLLLFMQARARCTNMEMFELEDLDAARARFAELSAAKTT